MSCRGALQAAVSPEGTGLPHYLQGLPGVEASAPRCSHTRKCKGWVSSTGSGRGLMGILPPGHPVRCGCPALSSLLPGGSNVLEVARADCSFLPSSSLPQLPVPASLTACCLAGHQRASCSLLPSPLVGQEGEKSTVG